MFGSNTTLGQQNSYKEGYNEGVDDVFIAFSEMLDTINDDNTYQILRRVYGKLSDKFPRPEDNYEE
jgi:hypothetical protein